MPKYYSSYQKAAHFAQLVNTDSPEQTFFDQMLASFQARLEQIPEYEENGKHGQLQGLVNLLESIQNSRREAAQSLHYNEEQSSYNSIKDMAANIREFEHDYAEYLQLFPEEQNTAAHEAYQDLRERPAPLGDALLDAHGQRKSAAAWIEESKAELASHSYEPDVHLARIIAARQLANANRGRRGNIDNTQLTDGQIENRARQLLEDSTFQAFLHQGGYQPAYQDDDLNNAILNTAEKEERAYNKYMSLLSQGHGGAFEDKLQDFIAAQPNRQNLDQNLYGRYQKDLYNEELCTANFKPVSDEIPASQQAVAEADLSSLKNLIKVENALGLDVLGDGRFAPMPDGSPRVFLLRNGEDGEKRLMSLDEAGIRRNSVEYYTAMQKGEVFAYPAGDKHPVQLQLSRPQGHVMHSRIVYSKPVPLSSLCPYPVPERPGFLTRWFQGLSSRARASMDAYHQAREKYDRFMNRAQEMEKSREKGCLDERRQAGENAKNAELAAEVRDGERLLRNKSIGYDRFISIYGPKPQLREDLLKAEVYTQEQFNALKPIDVDLSKVMVGGQSVEEDEFGSLAMSIALSPKYTGPAFKQHVPELAELSDHILQLGMGYTKEQAEDIAGRTCSTNYSIDYFKSDARANLGFGLPLAVEPARQDAAKLLKDYAAGKKDGLAEQLAKGISFYARESSGHDIDSSKTEYINFMGNASLLTSLMERDPELKHLAMTKYGLTASSIKTVKGMGKLYLLDQEAREAKARLHEAAGTGKTLGYEEKKACMNSILKFRLASAVVNGELSSLGKTDTRWQDNCNIANSKGVLSPLEQTSFMIGTEAIYKPVPKSLGKLNGPISEQNLSEIADAIMEGKDFEKKTEAEILKILNGKQYQGNSLILKGGQNLVSLQQQPEPEEQLQHDGPVLGAQNEGPAPGEQNQGPAQGDPDQALMRNESMSSL